MAGRYPRILANEPLDTLNYLDRNNIAAARLGTLEKDTGLVGNQYNTVIVCILPICLIKMAADNDEVGVFRRLHSDSDPNQHDS
jgi:hypothetical protein